MCTGAVYRVGVAGKGTPDILLNWPLGVVEEEGRVTGDDISLVSRRSPMMTVTLMTSRVLMGRVTLGAKFTSYAVVVLFLLVLCPSVYFFTYTALITVRFTHMQTFLAWNRCEIWTINCRRLKFPCSVWRVSVPVISGDTEVRVYSETESYQIVSHMSDRKKSKYRTV